MGGASRRPPLQSAMSHTTPPIPVNEAERLGTLARYRILDTAPEEAYDSAARLAAMICGTPLAFVSLVDKHRRWTKAAVGIEPGAVPRENSFCAHAINHPEEVMVIPDATRDERFADNPMVRDGPRLRFYAGAPLVTPEGFAIGTVCVADRCERNLSAAQQTALRMLATLVVSNLEERRVLADLGLRLETVQRLSHVGDWEYDVPKKQQYWSAEIYRILGVPPGSITPTLITALSCVHPEDRKRVHRFELSLRKTTEPRELEHRIIRPDGAVRHLRTRAEVKFGDDGQPLRFTGTVQDITDSKLAEEALHASEQRYKLVSRATSDVLWDWDLASGTIWRSEGFKTVFGFTSDEVEPVWDQLSKRLHAEDRDRVIDGLRRAIESGQETWMDEYRFRRTDNQYAVVRDRGTIIRDAQGTARRMVGGMTDLTEQKKLEAQYLRVQRMESIGTLAGGIAHDLNNVLSPIIMSIDLLRLEGSADPRHTQLLDTMRVSARRGADLVRQVLTFARGVEGQRVAVDLQPLIGDLAGMIAETFPPKIAIVREIPTNLWPVVGDATQIHQVLLNLAVNARDAMPDGGTLKFAADNLTADAQFVSTIGGNQPGPYVVLAVTDTGTGMPPEVRDRIFEPFFTTKERGKGTGLGLSTVHTIVKSHGGFLQVESAIGRGTTFRIYLPADRELAHRPPAKSAGAVPRGNGEWVLVVDDEEPVLTVTQRSLEAFGYQVLTASDGVEAVAVFAQHRDKVAVVVIDMAMPVMDGPSAINALLHIEPDLPIVAASGLASNVTLAKASVAGVKDFLAKPYTTEALLTLVRKALDRRKTPAAA